MTEYQYIIGKREKIAAPFLLLTLIELYCPISAEVSVDWRKINLKLMTRYDYRYELGHEFIENEFRTLIGLASKWLLKYFSKLEYVFRNNDIIIVKSSDDE